MSKPNHLEFVPLSLQPNTDSLDIQAQCIGIDASVIGDQVNRFKDNRGLHIQIRHNGDKQTFLVANQISNLIVAAPEMLLALDSLVRSLENHSKAAASIQQYQAIKAAVKCIQRIMVSI